MLFILLGLAGRINLELTPAFTAYMLAPILPATARLPASVHLIAPATARLPASALLIRQAGVRLLVTAHLHPYRPAQQYSRLTRLQPISPILE